MTSTRLVAWALATALAACRPQRGPVIAGSDGAAGPAPVASLAEDLAPPDDASAAASPDLRAPEAPPPCTKIERGAEQRRHAFVGRTIAELERSGGQVSCRGALVWQLHFGTYCGDLASFHDVVTVELRDGRVRRVWTREEYNDAWCDSPDL